MSIIYLYNFNLPKPGLNTLTQLTKWLLDCYSKDIYQIKPHNIIVKYYNTIKE